MTKLFLMRHLKSIWNTENRFTGWTDVPLDKNELGRAGELADKIFAHKIDKVYSSPLLRNTETLVLLLRHLGNKYPLFIHLDPGKMKDWGNHETIADDNGIPVYISEKLNERYYGKLQGINKQMAMQKYGDKLVHLWRRSYAVRPPAGESLKDVCRRTEPFYKRYIREDLKKGKNVLVVASHNSLRSIVKSIEKISDADIINLEIPFAGLMEYDLDEKLAIIGKKIF